MNKSILKSKTFWMQVLGVIAMLFPVVQEKVLAHPELIASVWGGLNIILRYITKDRVVLVDK